MYSVTSFHATSSVVVYVPCFEEKHWLENILQKNNLEYVFQESVCEINFRRVNISKVYKLQLKLGFDRQFSQFRIQITNQ